MSQVTIERPAVVAKTGWWAIIFSSLWNFVRRGILRKEYERYDHQAFDLAVWLIAEAQREIERMFTADLKRKAKATPPDVEAPAPTSPEEIARFREALVAVLKRELARGSGILDVVNSPAAVSPLFLEALELAQISNSAIPQHLPYVECKIRREYTRVFTSGAFDPMGKGYALKVSWNY